MPPFNYIPQTHAEQGAKSITKDTISQVTFFNLKMTKAQHTLKTKYGCIHVMPLTHGYNFLKIMDLSPQNPLIPQNKVII